MFSVYQSILQIKYVIDVIDEIGGKYMDAVIEILKGLDYSPLYVSLKTGIVATIFSFFLGLFAARKVIKAGPKVKAIADGILDTLEEKGLWKPEGARNSSTASESGRTSSDADTSASVSPADGSTKSDVGTLTNSGSVPDSPCTSDSAHMNPSDKNTDSEFPNSSPSVTYSVQAGAFRNPAYARRLLNELTEMDFPARIDDSSQYDRVLVGQFDVLNDAAMMERRLKQSGYPTVIVSFSEEA